MTLEGMDPDRDITMYINTLAAARIPMMGTYWT